MDLKERLSSRCHIEDIHEILFYVQGNQERKAELYDLIFDPDDAVSYQATHSLEPACTTTPDESPTSRFPELLPGPDAFSEGITRCTNALYETGI